MSAFVDPRIFAQLESLPVGERQRELASLFSLQRFGLDLEAAFHAAGNGLRVHGNGFIQLDLTERMRLHVWGDARIPRQSPESQIHNHTFGFTSHIMRGEIENRVYAPAMREPLAQDFLPHKAVVSHDADTKLVPSGAETALEVVRIETISEGLWYSMLPGEIHESVPHGVTVSIIVKDGPTLTQGGPSPTVYVPSGQEPDNVFDRYSAPPELLWRIIREAIQ